MAVIIYQQLLQASKNSVYGRFYLSAIITS